MADGGSRLAAGLTEAQEGLWFAQRLDPGNPAFVTAHVVELRGELDLRAFTAAMDGAVAEADALALRIQDGPDGAVQCVDPALRPWLEVVDLPGSDPIAEAWERVARAADTPMAPGGRLAGETLFRLSPSHHLWFHRAHHLVLDGYGADLLIHRVAALYGEAVAGVPAGPALAPFQTVLAADAAYRASPRRTADAAYWQAMVADVPDAAAAPLPSRFAHRAQAALLPPVVAALHRTAARCRVGWPDLLAALLGVYCRRMANEAEVTVGVALMNRFGSAAARAPSTLTNVLPLRVRGSEDAGLEVALADAFAQLAAMRRHGRYRGEQIRRDAGRAGLGRPLCAALVNIQPFHRLPAFHGLSAALHLLGTGPVDDLSFDVRGAPDADSFQLVVETNPARHTAGDTEAHAVRAAAFLAAALEAGRLGDAPTATPAEAFHLTVAVNDTAHPVADTTLAALLAAAMEAHPDATALVADDDLPGHQRLAYGELDRRSAALAAELHARGIGPGHIVAIALERSVDLVVGLLGIIRAGAAYLPLDPEHPPDRLARILDAAAPALVLARAGLAVPGTVLPPNAWPQTGRAPAGPAPGDAAYVIYTSGSTGMPKGVVVEHRAIVNRLEWMRERYGIGPQDRILQKTPATFDVSVWEFFLPLIVGGTLVLAPPGAHRDPTAIAALIRGHAITTAHFVPSMLAAFLAHPAARGLALRRVFCSGEALGAELRDRFHGVVRAELHNLYGPTEAAVDVTAWDASAGDASRPVPIGRPVWNTRLYVLDAALRPVPPGVAGALFIAGVQLARGYLGRPDLTAQAFLPDPFHPGERMYRTGDVARVRADGALLYLGRADDQVKLRGLRIEPGEVEAALAASPLVRQARVTVREDRPGDRRLVAYLVPEPGYTEAALRVHAASTLPDYMVPSAFVPLAALPVNPSGKLDRAALPAPAAGADAAGGAPATPAELQLTALFADALGLPHVGSDQDFFVLGGNSLLAVELMLQVQAAFGCDPGLGALFAHPTPARLARLLASAHLPPPDDGLRPMIRLSGGGDRPPLFVVHPAGGLAWCYGGLARALGPDRTVFGLQAPSLDGVTPAPTSLDALAEDYAARILASRPGGPIHLAGWSVGGIIAHAVAVRLRDANHPVGTLALLDAYPADAWRAEPDPSAATVLRGLLAVAGHTPAEFEDMELRRDAVLAFLRQGGTPLGRLPAAVLDGVVRVMEGNNRLVRGHVHRRYDGTLTHVRASSDHAGRSLAPGMWAPYAAAVSVHNLPLLHGEMMGAAASEALAPLLRGLMDG